MISKFCAVWLVALVLSPFTAPFATYDLGHQTPIRVTGRGWRLDQPVEPAAIAINAAVLPSRVIAERQRFIEDVAHLDGRQPVVPVKPVPVADGFPLIQQYDALRVVLRL